MQGNSDQDNVAGMPDWQQAQYRCFMGFSNQYVSPLEIKVLSTAFQDGLMLVRLLEKLSGEKIPGINNNPKMRIHKINNLSACFKFVKAIENFPVLENISPEDIADGNIKLILGFLWISILHFQVKGNKVESADKDENDDESDDEDEGEEEAVATQAAVGAPVAGPAGGDGLDAALDALDILSGEKVLSAGQSAPSLPPRSPSVGATLSPRGAVTTSTPSTGAAGAAAVSTTPASAIAKPLAGSKSKAGSRRAAAGADPKKHLLERVREHCKDCPPQSKREINNFHSDWQDGFAFLQLIYCQDPEAINLEDARAMSPLERVERAFRIMTDDWDVPPLLDAKQVVSSRPDEKSVMTYVSLSMDHFDKGKGKRGREMRRERRKARAAKKGGKVKKTKKKPEGGAAVSRDVGALPAVTGQKVPMTVRVAGARDIDTKDGAKPSTYAVVSIPSKQTKKLHKTEVVPGSRDPEWNQDFCLDDEDITDADNLRVFIFNQDGSGKDTPLGYADIPAAKLKGGTQDLWLPIRSTSGAEDEQGGELHLVVAPGPKAKLPPIVGETMDMRLCSCRNLASPDKTNKCDPYVVVDIEGSKRRPRQTKTKKATIHPVYNKKFHCHRGEVSEKDTLVFTVYDFKRVGKDDKLGTVRVPAKDFVASPEYDEWLPLGKGDGQLHLQAAWGKAHLPPKPTGTPLVVRVAKANHLKAADRHGYSDPYCQVSVVGHKAEKGNKTKVIKGTLNPEWNDEFLFDGTAGPEDALRFDIYDHDRVTLRPRALGHVILPLSEIETSPVLDKWLPLSDANPKKAGQGDLHIQLAYGDNELPPVPSGTPLAVRVGAGRDLKATDRSGNSDPYVKIKLQGKRLNPKLQTSVVKRTVNPEWNEEFSFERGVLDVDVDTAEFIVYDHDRIKRNEPLGVVQVPLKQLKQTPVTQMWLPLLDPSTKGRGEGEILLAFAYGEDARLPPLGSGLAVRLEDGRNLRATAADGLCDPYVVMEIVGGSKPRKCPFRSKIVKDNVNPQWFDTFEYNAGEVNPETDALRLTLYDYNKDTKHDPQGQVIIPLKSLKDKPVQELVVPVMEQRDPTKKAQGEVKVVLAYGEDLPPAARSKPVRVRVVGATKLRGPADPFTEIKIGGKKIEKAIKTRTQKGATDPDWNYEYQFASGELEPSRDVLRFVVKNDKDEAVLGESEWAMTPLLQKPSHDLFLTLRPGKKQRGDETCGTIHVQIAYDDAPFPKAGENFSLVVVEARNLKPGSGSVADPYVVINRPNNPFRRKKTQIKKNTVHPVWKEQYSFGEGFINRDKDVMSFEIYSFNRVGKDDAIGYVEVPVRDFGINQVYDRWVPVNDPKSRSSKGSGELHLQGVYGDLPLFSAAGKGVRFRVAEAKNLTGADQSVSNELDPYAVAEVSGKKNLRKMKTKTVKKTADPLWNDEFSLPGAKISVPQDLLTVALYDYDIIGRKSPIGYAEFPLNNLTFEKPVADVWLPVYKDKSKKQKLPGEVHLVAALEGFQLPPASREFGVCVMQARNLRAGEKGAVPSAYIRIRVPGKRSHKRRLVTPKHKSVSPVWNQFFLFDTKYFDDGDVLQFHVKNWDILGRDRQRDPLGLASVQTSELFSQTFVDSWLPVKSTKGENATGDVRILYGIGADGMKQLAAALEKERNLPKRILPPKTHLRKRAIDEPDSDSEESSSSSSSDEEVSRDLGGKKVQLKLRLAGARDISPEGVITEPVGTLTVNGKKLQREYRTHASPNPDYPEWNYEFDLIPEDLNENDVLHFVFTDAKKAGGEPLGQADVPIKGLVKTLSTVEDMWIPCTTKLPRGADQEEPEFHLVTANGAKTKLPPVKGEPLGLRICGARNLSGRDRGGFSDPYVEFKLKDSKKAPRKTQTRKSTLHPVWNKRSHFMRGECKETDVLEFIIYDWNRVGKDEKLGQVEIPIIDFIATPEYDEWLPIKNGKGHLHIQAAWGSALLPPKPSGQPMIVRIAKARHLAAANKSGYSDPYCQISVAGRKGKRGNRTETIKNTLNPEWNEEFLFEGDVTPMDALRFEVYDQPSVLSALAKGKSLGYVNLPLAELEEASNVDIWLALRDVGSRRKDKGQGEIHIQIAYGENAQLPPVPEGLPLTLRVAAARDLPPADASDSGDPFVVIKIKAKKIRRKMKTKVIEQNLNPEWNEEFSFERGEINIDDDVLQFIVYDRDRSKNSTPLASAEFALAPLKAKNISDVWLPSTIGDGQVHVLFAWGNVSLPRLGAPFAVRVAEGISLKGKGQTSNPYATLEIVGPTSSARKRPFKTKVVKENLNPVWYDEFNFPRGEVNPETDTLRVVLYDHIKVGQDASMGQVLVPLKPLLKTPVLEGLFPVMDAQSAAKKGQGEIRLAIAFGEGELPAVAAGKALTLRVVSAKDVEGSQSSYVHVKIAGKTSKRMRTPTQHRTYNPEWNTQFSFRPGELNARGDALRFVLKSEGEVKDTTLGVAELPLLQLMTTPVFDQWLPVKGARGEVATQIRVQVGYGGAELPKIGEKLSLRVVAGRDLKAMDRGGYADPYVVINRVGRPFARRLRTDTKKATVHPVWNEEFYFDEGAINPEKEVLSFDVFNWDRIGKDGPLGYVELPVKDIKLNTLYDKWLPLNDPKAHDKKGTGDIRVQAMFGSVPLPATSSGQKIQVRICEGRALPGVDRSGTSDPYCVLSVNGKKLRKFQTPVVKKSLTPVWNATFDLPGDKLAIDSDVIHIDVLDWDRIPIAGKSSELGFVEFPLKPLREQPVQEMWLPLKSSTGGKSSGEIKVQFALEGHQLPPCDETFVLCVLEAKNVANATDPYCIISVPGKKTATVLKTPSDVNSKNPIWNQRLYFNTTDFNITTDELRFDVCDWGRGKKEPAHVAQVPVEGLFDQPFLDIWVPLDDGAGNKTNAQLHIVFGTGLDGEKRAADLLPGGAPADLFPPDTEVKKLRRKAKKPAEPKEKKVKEKKPKEVKVKEAPRDIPVSPRGPVSPRPEVHTKIKVRIAEARNLPAADRGGASDAYVLLEVPGRRMKRRIYTKTVKKALSPVWNEEFDLSNENIDPDTDFLMFVIYDWVRVGDNLPMCCAKIPVRELTTKPLFDEWLPLGEYGNTGKKISGEIHIVTAYNDRELPDIVGRRRADGVNLHLRVCEARDLSDEFNPYVVVEVPRKKHEKRVKTRPTRKTTEPIWDEDFDLSSEGVLANDLLSINVFHHNHDLIGVPLTKDVHLGQVTLQVSSITNEATDKWYKLEPMEGSKNKVQGEIRLVASLGGLPEKTETRGGGQSQWRRRLEAPAAVIPGKRLLGRSDKSEKKKEKKKDKK